eukprot:s5828_g3.t1
MDCGKEQPQRWAALGMLCSISMRIREAKAPTIELAAKRAFGRAKRRCDQHHGMALCIVSMLFLLIIQHHWQPNSVHSWASSRMQASIPLWQEPRGSKSIVGGCLPMT